jgi:hypothetical protein
MGHRTKFLIYGYFYFAIIGAICYFLKLHFILTTILFMVIPTLVLVLSKREIIRELTLFSISLGIPVGFYTQIIAERNSVWKYIPFVPEFHAKDVPLEALFWYVAWFGLVIAVYLYFFDGHKHRYKEKGCFKKHFKYFIYCSSLFLFSCVLVNINTYYSVFPHPYISLISPVVLISIFLFFFHKHKNFFKIFVPTTLVLFLPMLFYDLIGVSTGQWTFPGEYLYQINFGLAKLPVEEFLIWLWIWPSSVIAYFEEYESNFR